MKNLLQQNNIICTMVVFLTHTHVLTHTRTQTTNTYIVAITGLLLSLYTKTMYGIFFCDGNNTLLKWPWKYGEMPLAKQKKKEKREEGHEGSWGRKSMTVSVVFVFVSVRIDETCQVFFTQSVFHSLLPQCPFFYCPSLFLFSSFANFSLSLFFPSLFL